MQADLLLDSFEGDISSQTVDFEAGNSSRVEVFAEKEIKVCGEQSLKIVYEVNPVGYMRIARGYNFDVKVQGLWFVEPQDVVWSDYDSVSINLYGSNSGGLIVFDIKDSGDEVWRFLIDDDFEGFKEIIMPFKLFFVRDDWQPDKAQRNEALDFPIMSFQLEPRTPGKGVLYIDCVKLKLK